MFEIRSDTRLGRLNASAEIALSLSIAFASLLWAAGILAGPDAARTGQPAETAERGPAPSPDLAPDNVVRLQIQALRGNDAADRGIVVAYRFASPANKLSTGPLPRFIHMIKAGPYRLMLEFDRASYGPMEIRGDRAAQRVTLVGSDDVRTYVFLLGRQKGPPCVGCWMTEAVMVVPAPAQGAWTESREPDEIRLAFGTQPDSGP